MTGTNEHVERFTRLRVGAVPRRKHGGVILVEISAGVISNFYAMRNPEKLRSVNVTRKITRST